MLRILHLADLHLGWTPKGLPSDQAAARRERRDAMLAQAVDLALAEQVDLVLIAGDLFESYRPSAATLALALQQLGRLQAAGVALVTVPGNHDELSYAQSVYRVEAARWPGLLVTRPDPGLVRSISIKGQDVHLSGLAYVGGLTRAHRPIGDWRRGDEHGLHLAIAHGTLLRSGSVFGGERSLPIDQAALGAAGFDYVALGHIHVPQTIELGRGPAVYPGCVGGKGLDDLGATHWTLVEWQDGRSRVMQLPAMVQPMRLQEVDLGDFDDVAALEDALSVMADPDAMLRLRLTGALSFPLDVTSLKARLAGHFFHLEIEDDSSAIDEGMLEAWAEPPTVRGAFVRAMRAKLQQAPDATTRRLLQRALRYGLHAFEAGDG